MSPATGPGSRQRHASASLPALLTRDEGLLRLVLEGTLTWRARGLHSRGGGVPSAAPGPEGSRCGQCFQPGVGFSFCDHIVQLTGSPFPLTAGDPRHPEAGACPPPLYGGGTHQAQLALSAISQEDGVGPASPEALGQLHTLLRRDSREQGPGRGPGSCSLGPDRAWVSI